jgi:outer membrane protein assembly factor BamB
MKRRDFAVLLLASLAPAGCGLFSGDKKDRLPGERISVLGLDRRYEPDPALANTGVTLPPPVLNPDWAEPGGNTSHSMQHLALPQSTSRAWRASVGDSSGRYTKVMSQPVVAKGRVFVMDGGVQVSAYEAATGNRLWQVDLKPEELRGNGFGGGPAFWNDRLYVSTGYAQVLALDPADGKVIWRKGLAAPIHSAPTVLDNRVFVVTVENELNALSVDDGRKLWSHNGIPEAAGLLGGASPAANQEVVVVAYSSGELFALRVENGRVIWSDNLASQRGPSAVAAMADIHGRPVIDRDRVFAVSNSGRMVAIDLRRGDRVWEQEISSSHQPWIAGEYVFVLANDNEVVCLTRKDGKIRWAAPLPRYEDEKAKSDPIRWAGPVLGGNRLIALSSTGEAMSISPLTGERGGSQPMSAGGYLGPVIADNTLYLLTDDADLSAYR